MGRLAEGGETGWVRIEQFVGTAAAAEGVAMIATPTMAAANAEEASFRAALEASFRIVHSFRRF